MPNELELFLMRIFCGLLGSINLVFWLCPSSLAEELSEFKHATLLALSVFLFFLGLIAPKK